MQRDKCMVRPSARDFKPRELTVVDQNRSPYLPLFALTRTDSLERDGDTSTFKNNYRIWVTVTLENAGRAIALFDSMEKAAQACRALKLSGMSGITIESLEKLRAILKPIQEGPDDARIENICWNVRADGESDRIERIADALERFSKPHPRH